MKAPKAFWIGMIGVIAGCTQLLELDQEYRPSQTGSAGMSGASGSAGGGVAGAGGSPECAVDTDCPSLVNTCTKNACMSNVCVANNLPAGTICGGGICDGSGSCKMPNGSTCMHGTSCTSGDCVDGYCCDGNCTAKCKACNVGGLEGKCSIVPAGYTDDTCLSPKSCDGTTGGNSCFSKFPMGYPCTLGTQCGGAICVDEVCCNASCTATCQSCNLTGNVGTCSNVPANADDAPTCSGTDSCDGNGICKTDTGATCSTTGECMSAFCIDGVCCNSACLATCQSCNVMGLLGTCVNVPADQEDPVATTACTGVHSCNGAGTCLLDNGQPCSRNAQCVSNNCTGTPTICQ